MMRGVTAMLEKHHRCDPRRGRRGGGQALAPLHPRPAAPRQVGQPARHRLRARGDRPERRPAAPSRTAAASIDHLKSSSSILDREQAHRRRHQGSRAQGREALRRARRPGWQGSRRDGRREKALVERSRVGKIVRRALREASRRHSEATAAGAHAAERRLQAERDARRTAELAQLQGESPLMQVGVDAQTIAEVVAGWTGIPVGKMVAERDRDRAQPGRSSRSG